MVIKNYESYLNIELIQIHLIHLDQLCKFQQTCLAFIRSIELCRVVKKANKKLFLICILPIQSEFVQINLRIENKFETKQKKKKGVHSQTTSHFSTNYELLFESKRAF
jgi:hypothetical protein